MGWTQCFLPRNTSLDISAHHLIQPPVLVIGLATWATIASVADRLQPAWSEQMTQWGQPLLYLNVVNVDLADAFGSICDDDLFMVPLRRPSVQDGPRPRAGHGGPQSKSLTPPSDRHASNRSGRPVTAISGRNKPTTHTSHEKAAVVFKHRVSVKKLAMRSNYAGLLGMLCGRMMAPV